MSRDHYKGVPKTRDAVIKADGTIAPLGLLDESGTLKAPYLAVEKHPPSGTKKVTYARAFGSDANGDGTLEKPYRTLKRALEDLPSILDNTYWWIDITGIGTESSTDSLIIPTMIGNAQTTYDLDVPDGGVGVPQSRSLIIYAGLNVLEEMTITSTSATVGAALKNYTDSSKNWTPGEHKGKFLIDSSGFDVGTVYDNDATTLYTTYGYSAPSGTIRICDLSAKLDYGATAYSASVKFSPINGGVVVFGVEFAGSANTGIDISGVKDDINFSNCSINVKPLVHQMPGAASFSNCHIKDTYLYTNSTSCVFWNCYFENAYHFSEGALGDDTFATGIRVEGNSKPFGAANGSRVEGSWRYANVSISGSTGDGISAHGFGWNQLDYAYIEHTGGDAVSVNWGATARLRGVYGGEGVGGYGINIGHQGYAYCINGTNVSGTLGDVKVGAQAAQSYSTINSNGGSLDLTPDTGTLARCTSS
jgi:hypothetical protein